MLRTPWITVLLLCSANLFAQSTAPAPPPNEDSKILRQLIEQQSRQIDALTHQVAKLAQLIESTHGSGTAAVAIPAASPLPQTAPPLAHTTPPLQETNPAEVAKGDAGQATHVVAKGETLPSIARQYKIAVGDLQTANKIENDRKLQIGQTLIIPAQSPEAKENQ
ncbi:MAG: LysM peptidoglycan-binding domain-containing protein [Verrucomicrobiota bacterium]|nr:LysM peptidoglycan-binding domain-containing protein [Verrucomicrobiota bacterium]